VAAGRWQRGVLDIEVHLDEFEIAPSPSTFYTDAGDHMVSSIIASSEQAQHTKENLQCIPAVVAVSQDLPLRSSGSAPLRVPLRVPWLAWPHHSSVVDGTLEATMLPEACCGSRFTTPPATAPSGSRLLSASRYHDPLRHSPQIRINLPICQHLLLQPRPNLC
jgi:hypothetical protein